jgi:hypothetical protein
LGERPESDLRKHCDALVSSIDDVMGELVGDKTYLHIEGGHNRG